MSRTMNMQPAAAGAGNVSTLLPNSSSTVASCFVVYRVTVTPTMLESATNITAKGVTNHTNNVMYNVISNVKMCDESHMTLIVNVTRGRKPELEQ